MRTEFKAASQSQSQKSHSNQILLYFSIQQSQTQSPQNSLREKKILSTKSGENPVERKKKSFSNYVVSLTLFNIHIISLTAYIVSLV